MSVRADQIATFLRSAGWQDAARRVIAGDASNRRYERLTRTNGETAVLMDAPADKGEDVRPFVRIARWLQASGLSAPEILAEDAALGCLLLEDLGDAIYARVLEQDPGLETEIYTAATDALLHMHRQAAPALPAYDAATMTPLAALAFDWYQKGALERIEGKESFSEVFRALLTPLDPMATVLIQRDYHAENLIWLPGRQGMARVGMLDFQDAMLGHPAYDLVSVLQDARRDVPEETEARMIQHFVRASGHDPQGFDHAYTLLGLQRNLRILGVFARLSMAYGKAHYVDLIPRVWDHISRGLHRVDTESLRRALDVLPAPTPEILKSLKDQCGQFSLQ